MGTGVIKLKIRPCRSKDKLARSKSLRGASLRKMLAQSFARGSPNFVPRIAGDFLRRFPYRRARELPFDDSSALPRQTSARSEGNDKFDTSDPSETETQGLCLFLFADPARVFHFLTDT